MATIGRSFDEFNKKVKEFDSNIKQTNAQVKDLDKNLKLNPGSVDTIRQKYQLLEQNLKTTADKITTLKQKQDALKNDVESSAITQNEYNKQLEKLKKDLDNAKKSEEELTNALSKQNEEIRNAKLDNLTKGLDKAQEGAKKTSKAVLGVVAAFSALFATSVKIGDELDDNAKKYQTTAELLQIQKNRYAKLTADSDTYVNSLSKIGGMLTSITAGRGAKYLTYLEQLGISQQDLAHKTNAEVFELVYEKLRLVNDETDRSIIAQGLLGDAGLNVATVAGTSAETIQSLDDALISNGIISSEQAAKAGECADQLDSLKYQFQASSAEVMVALLPAFQTLVDILRDHVIPFVSKVANAIGNLAPWQQKVLLLLLGALIVLPKIIALVKGIVGIVKIINALKIAHATATGVQAVAMKGLTTASAPWIGIIMAISLVLIGLIKLIGVFNKSAKEAVDSSTAMIDSLDSIDTKARELGIDTSYATESTYNQNNNKKLEIDLNVDAKGDGTEVNQNNADIIANTLENKILTDLINQGLGSVIR